MSLPFRQLAILDPQVCYSADPLSLSTSRLREESLAWWQVAQRNGADAIYVRMHTGAAFEAEVIGGLVEKVRAPIVVSIQWVDQFPELGIHLRGRDPLPLRKTGWWGRSCHRPEEVAAASQAGMDYVTYSPVFATKSHPGQAGMGLTKLASVCTASSVPVVALGGISRENMADCFAAGAQGIAAIRMFMS